jgi:transcriptional regulator with XRE-family HTH domain
MVEDTWAEPLGQRLKRLRLARGLSQRDVSSPGVSYAYISRIEAGARTPSVKALRQLARKLGVSVEYLETGREIGDVDDRERRLADAELELRLVRDAQSALGKLSVLLEEAEAAGDRPAALRAKTALGLAASQRGRNLEAVELLEEVTSEENAPPPNLRPDLYVTLAQAYASLGAPDRAVAVLERCLDEVKRRAPDDAPAQVRFATFLSYALTDAGDYERAEDVVSEALVQAEQSSDLYTRVRLYWSMSRLAGIEGRAVESLEYIRRAITLLETIEDTVMLARAYLLAANVEISQHDEANARRHVERAAGLFGPAPDVGDLGMLKVLQSALAPDADEAVAIAREAITLLGEHHPGDRGGAALALARGFGRKGDVDAANDAYGAAVDLMSIHGRTVDATTACREWEELLRAAGRDEEAERAASRAKSLSAARAT